MVDITRLDSTSNDFWNTLEKSLAWEGVSDDKVNTIVREILAGVRERGDAALLEYTNRLDRMNASSMEELEIPQVRLHQALEAIPQEQREALEHSAERVRIYHEKQKQESWSYTEADGTLLGQQVTPLDRAGLYVPGGKAA
ncbi:MAG: histidinol dehydrogenase, partial [Gammaproteobacteria bacterium]|nr:histidinol dehydrogenase [Gammaproteobacteria bacterium]